MQFSRYFFLILSIGIISTNDLNGMGSNDPNAPADLSNYPPKPSQSSRPGQEPSAAPSNEDKRLYAGLLNVGNRLVTLLEKITEPKPDNRPEYKPHSVPVVDKELQKALIDNCPPQLKDILEQITYAQESTTPPERCEFIMSSHPNLILFEGPPGVGKTSTGIAIAGHLNWNLVFKEAGALCNKYKNSGIEGVNNLFHDALKTNSPHVIILDELKGLTDKHNNEGDFDANVVEYLWQKLDKCTGKKILVIATTNDASKIPAALKSRFSRDFSFHIPLPNDQLRLTTFILCLPRKIEKEDISVSYADFNEEEKQILIKKSNGFSQRDIVGIANKARHVAQKRAIAACKANPSHRFIVMITFADLNNEINAILPGWRQLWGWNKTVVRCWPYFVQAMRLGYTTWNIYLQYQGHINHQRGLEYQVEGLSQARIAHQTGVAQHSEGLAKARAAQLEQMACGPLFQPLIDKQIKRLKEQADNKFILDKQQAFLEVFANLVKKDGFEVERSEKVVTSKGWLWDTMGDGVVQTRSIADRAAIKYLFEGMQKSPEGYTLSSRGHARLISLVEKAGEELGLNKSQTSKLHSHLSKEKDLAKTDSLIEDESAQLIASIQFIASALQEKK